MRRTTISILLAAGLLAIPAQAVAKTPKPCVVPSLTGKTLVQARHRLNAAHCQLGHITRPKDAVIASTLKVASQSAKAGKHHQHGFKVRVTLKGKAKPATAAPVSTPVSVPAPVPAAAPQISYKAAVDPSFTQDPDNPLAVTYSYSADATSMQGGITNDLAGSDQLPAGVLDFFNGGLLACSMNVGGATTGGTCQVQYGAAGTYSVTTEYIPNGTTAVTQTEQETIQPYASSVFLAAAVGGVSGNSFPVAFDAVVLGPNGNDAAPDVSLNFTITDDTTGATVESFMQPADKACAIVVSVNLNDTQTFQGAQAPLGCNLNPITVSLDDTYSVTAFFPGSSGYLSSTSNPGAL